MPDTIPLIDLIRPSSAERWMVCPGSVRLTADIPDVTSEYAAEGTRAHELAEKALKAGCCPSSLTDDEDMAEYVSQYVVYVQNLAEGA